MNRQKRILRELLRNKDKMSIPEMKKMTEFKESEIYRALYHLKNRGLIKVDREIGSAGYKSPPTGRIYISMNPKCLKRVRELVENG